MANLFVCDAETDGLYGPVCAIGAVVQDERGRELTRFAGQIDPSTVQTPWVRENVIPHVDLPLYESGRALREAIWAFWMTHKRDAVCIADMGSPVESGLFRACVEDEPGSRTFEGPYPLHEVGTLLLAARINPDINRIEFSSLQGLMQHNPVDDCIASAACWRKALERIHMRRPGRVERASTTSFRPPHSHSLDVVPESDR